MYMYSFSLTLLPPLPDAGDDVHEDCQCPQRVTPPLPTGKKLLHTQPL